ncbi:TetR/AcrR family transcriptional regulator [Brevibacterium album]|uniref:TetR/AcrR family transcriptional regulator n=1 Tax=Brevibacterium album TaxID=417948 RepID=UPI00146FC7E1|nr:TetR/AcrR family transcriptional regulator [Brevibacterium album]
MPFATRRLPRAERRAQLVECATRVIAARGYSSSSMDDVAEAAGISKPVLYQHFDSKLALYLEVVRQASGRLETAILSALATEGGTRGRIRATISAFFGFVDDHRDQYTIVFSLDSYEPEARAIVAAVRSRLTAEIARAVAQGVETDARTAEFIGNTVTSMGESAARYVAADPELDRERAADSFTSFLVSGLDGLYGIGD